MTPPRKFSALPPQDSNEASPKAITGRTSYLRVRLEFLPYPHLITTLFNGCVFGPPLPFTATSTWTWVDHPVSGLHTRTLRPIKTWFPFGSGLSVLNLARMRNSPDRSTKSTRLHSYGASTVCKHRVSGSLSLPSRGPFHLSFTVLCSIGHWVVFSLGGWSPRLPTRFLVSRGTLDPVCSSLVSCTRLSRSLAGFPKTIPLPLRSLTTVRNPGMHARRFGLFPFRSPLLRKSIFLSLPPGT